MRHSIKSVMLTVLAALVGTVSFAQVTTSVLGGKIIDETGEPAAIYTFNADLKKRLKSFSKKHPDLCNMTVEDKEFGSMTYEIDKSRLQIRFTAPYSAERKECVGKMGRKNKKKSKRE